MKSALEYLDYIVGAERPALFLDFDGTLAEIAPRPDRAALPDSVHGALEALASLGVPLAIVSGRDLDDLRRRVDLPSFAYAGSHGFDILGPAPAHVRHRPGERFLPVLDGVERELRERLATVAGVFIERKRFAFAVHYRQVDLRRVAEVMSTVRTVAASHRGVQVREGKMVLEMVPDVHWDKGQAVLWLLERMGGTPIYIGDDVTDEDAFRALVGRGTGIVVQETPAPTAASYRLRNPGEVEQFLWACVERLKNPAGA